MIGTRPSVTHCTTPPYIIMTRGSVEHWYLCWLTGFLGYPIPIFFISQLPSVDPIPIDHFLCDMDPLMALSCAPAPLLNLFFILRVPLSSFSLLRYSSILHPAAQSCFSDPFYSWPESGAFSTCGSHLTVSLFLWDSHGNVCESYIWHLSFDAEKILTLVYSIMTPFLNPRSIVFAIRT